MSARNRWTIAVVVLLVLVPQLGNAQARVTGVVRGNGNGDNVANAQVQIVDRRLRTLSGDDGRFVFESVPPGTHTLRVARIGYAPTELELAVTIRRPSS